MSSNMRQRRFNKSSQSTSVAQRRGKRSQRDWRRRWRYFYLRFVRLRGSPEAIARGAAAGVFAGWFPLIATQMAAAILLAALIKGNKIVAAAATWVSNPLTSIPIYAFNFHVGRWLLRSQEQSFSGESISSWQGMMQMGTEFLVDLLVGCFVVGSLCSVGSYFLCLWFVRRVRDKRRY
ncbi:DUF2062 domain-containing protein [Microseira sp. BLCC-F43]|uniref:DUF2062 domain-containing protein n=1 Tax=Microseira sp. BLCC-F43 TaxID=3153602 RepID=UPI0035BC6FF5